MPPPQTLGTTQELGSATYVSLATFRRDGREVRTPVWVAEAEGRLYVFSESAAGKVKRIRATRRVALAPCGVRGGLRGEFSEGVGRIVTEPDVTERGYQALRRKYGWQMRTLDFVSTLTGRIGNRAVLELEIEESAE